MTDVKNLSCLFAGLLFPPLRDGQGQDQGQQHWRLLLHQTPVQLGGLVDQGLPLHADKPQVGPGLDHIRTF